MVQRVERNAHGDGSKNYTAHIGMHSACTLHQTYVYLLGMVMTWYFHGMYYVVYKGSDSFWQYSIKSRMRQREI